MSENKSVNQRCLEDILCHLTKMVVLTEHDETDRLKYLVKMSTSVSAQLLGITKQEENNNAADNNNLNNDIGEVNMTSEQINDYIKARQGKLSRDEISLLIRNKQAEIDHLQFDYNKGKWQIWDTTGKHFEFCKKQE